MRADARENHFRFRNSIDNDNIVLEMEIAEVFQLTLEGMVSVCLGQGSAVAQRLGAVPKVPHFSFADNAIFLKGFPFRGERGMV